MRSKMVRIFLSRETSVFTVFREFQFFCSYYVGASNYVHSLQSKDPGISSATLGIRCSLSLSLVLLGFSANACPEMSLKQVFSERALSDLDFFSHKVFLFQEGRSDTFSRGHFENRPLA